MAWNNQQDIPIQLSVGQLVQLRATNKILLKYIL